MKKRKFLALGLSLVLALQIMSLDITQVFADNEETPIISEVNTDIGNLTTFSSGDDIGEPLPASGDPTFEVSIPNNSIPFYVTGKDATLWDYTKVAGNNIKYRVNVASEGVSEGVNRTLVIDINPYGIVPDNLFPFEIKETTNDIDSGFQQVEKSENNTVVTYTRTNTSNFSGYFEVTIGLREPHQYTEYYPSGGPSKTVAAAIGSILFDYPLARFGIKVEYDDGVLTNDSGAKINHVFEGEHKPNVPTNPTDSKYNLVGDTYVVDGNGNPAYSGAVDTAGKAIPLNPFMVADSTNNGIGALYLASDGKLYFKGLNAAGEAIYLQTDTYSLKTELNTADHAPITDFTYKHYFPDGFASAYGSNLMGDDNSLTAYVGYLKKGTEKDFYGYHTLGGTYYDLNVAGGEEPIGLFTDFTAAQADFLEGSLVQSADLTPAVYRPLYFGKWPSYKYVGSDSYEELKEDKAPIHFTVTGEVSSYISYQEMGKDAPTTKNFDNEIVINIPEYGYIDNIVGYAGNDPEVTFVAINKTTEELSFKIDSAVPDEGQINANKLSQTYPNGKLTITMPNAFDVTKLSLSNSYAGLRMHTGYRIYNGETELKSEVTSPINNFEVDIPAGATHITFDLPEKGIGDGTNFFYSINAKFTGSFPEDHGLVDEEEVTSDIYFTNSSGERVTGESEIDDKDLDPVWTFLSVGEEVDSVNFRLQVVQNGEVIDPMSMTGSFVDSDTKGVLLWAENSSDARSIVYENARFYVESDQPSHIELIDNVYWYASSKTSMVVVDGAEIIAYFTTKEKPDEVQTQNLESGFKKRFSVPDGETLATLYFEVEKIQYQTDLIAESYPLIMFHYRNTRLSPDVLGLYEAGEEEGVYAGDLKVTFTADNGNTQKISDTRYFEYEDIPLEFVPITTTNHNIPDLGIADSRELKYTDSNSEFSLGYVAGVSYDFNNNGYTGYTGSGIYLPKGTAIYLQVNDESFEYVGNNSQISKMTIGGEQWIRYDISGREQGPETINFSMSDFLIKGRKDQSVNLFLDSYLDLGPMLAMDPEDINFYDFVLDDIVAIADTDGITTESDILNYGSELVHDDMTDGKRLVKITGANGKNPEDYLVSIIGASFTSIEALPRVEATTGHTGTVNYFAHQSDDLYLDIAAVRVNDMDTYNLTIELPTDDAMDLRFSADVETMLPADWKALSPTVTYSNSVGGGIATWENAKTVTIAVENLKKSEKGDSETDAVTNSKYLNFKLVPSGTGEVNKVYSEEDGSNSIVKVSYEGKEKEGPALSSKVPIEAYYVFKWYEISGIAFLEEDNVSDGIYNNGDRYLTTTEFNTASLTLNGELVPDERVSYNELTGKYTIEVQPQETEYELKFTPANAAVYEVTDELPSMGSLALNNNHPTSEGIKFNANIVAGLSTVAGAATNLKQEEIDKGLVDIAIKAETITVTYVQTTDGDPNVDIFHKDTLIVGEKITNTTTSNPNGGADEVFVGWFEKTGDILNEKPYIFGQNSEKDKNIILYPKFVGKDTVELFEVIFEDVKSDTTDSSTTEIKTDIASGSTIPNTQKPVPGVGTGGTLEGWYTNKEFTDEWVFETNTVEKDEILYPKVTYPVIFKDPSDETLSKDLSEEDVIHGDTVDKPTNAELTDKIPDGKEIFGWTTDSTPDETSTPWDFNTPIEETVTLYPILKDKEDILEDKWTVIFKDTDGTNADTYLNVDDNASIPKTSEAITIPEDKELIGWTTDENSTESSKLWNFNDDGENANDNKVTEDIILYPVLKDKETPPTGGGTRPPETVDPVDPTIEHTVTFEDDDFTDTTIHDEVTVPDGETVSPPTEPTPPTENDKFVGWYEDEELTIPYDFDDPVTEDITLYPKFEDKETVPPTYEESENDTDDTPKDVVTDLEPDTDIAVDNDGGTNPDFDGDVAVNPEPSRPDTTLPTIVIVPTGATVTPEGLVLDENGIPLGWLPIPEGYTPEEVTFGVDGTPTPLGTTVPQTNDVNNLGLNTLSGLGLLALALALSFKRKKSKNN